MDWTPKIEFCFGMSDLIFAGHPNDEDRAFELLTLLRKEHVGWKEVSNGLRKFLTDAGAAQDHIDRQIKKASEFFKPWLLD